MSDSDTNASELGLESDSDIPAVELSSAEDNDPVMSCRIIPDDLVDDKETHGASSEHRQDLERDNSRVGESPAGIGTRILFP